MFGMEMDQNKKIETMVYMSEKPLDLLNIVNTFLPEENKIVFDDKMINFMIKKKVIESIKEAKIPNMVIEKIMWLVMSGQGNGQYSQIYHMMNGGMGGMYGQDPTTMWYMNQMNNQNNGSNGFDPTVLMMMQQGGGNQDMMKKFALMQYMKQKQEKE